MRRMSKKSKNLSIIIILITSGITIPIIVLLVINPATTSYDLVLKVGAYENAPKIYTDEAGNLVGLFPELLEYIAEQENWKIEWVHGTWTECLDRLENGTIDIMVDVAYSDTRAAIYDFNQVEVLNNWGIIYKGAGEVIDSIDDLEGKNVATMAGSIHTDGDEGIKNLTKKWNINCTFIELADYTAVFEKVDSGTADAGVVNRLFGLVNEEEYAVERTSILFNPSRLLFAFNANASINPEIIPKIDEQLLILKEDTNSIYYYLINKYIFGIATILIPAWVFPTIIIAAILIATLSSTSYVLRRMVSKKTGELKKAHDELELKVKSRTKELSKANERLQELDHLKSMFIASMNHELRTPLTSIVGFTRMILKGRIGEINTEQKEQLEIILRNANYLHDLINDIIDISKIEADKLDIRKERFDLVKQLEDLKATFNEITKTKGIHIEIEVPDSLLLFNDKKRVNQILVNLIGNAVKFTDAGKVLINVIQSNKCIEISVEDTGQGIKDKNLEKLFKPFSRITTKGKSIEGTGLGLHISRKLAKLLGGDISVSSEYGKGSTFTLLLNLQKEEYKK